MCTHIKHCVHYISSEFLLKTHVNIADKEWRIKPCHLAWVDANRQTHRPSAC